MTSVFLSRRRDSNTRPLRPERSALPTALLLEKISLRLCKLINIYLNAALEIGSLVLVYQAYLCELVNHCENLGSILLCNALVCCVAYVADGVTRCLCIILVMQSVPLVLAIGFLC